MAKWQELTEEFQELSPEERLEELMESAERLPPVSASRLTTPLPESCRVKECQTPVYLWVDVHEGRVHLEAEVSPKSPTVRGLVSLVVEASLPNGFLGGAKQPTYRAVFKAPG